MREKIRIINQSNNFKRIVKKIRFYICINYIISCIIVNNYFSIYFKNMYLQEQLKII